MANQIILKRSSQPAKVPTTAQLALGELAINTHDGKVFIKKDDGTPSVIEVGAVQSVNGASGAVTLTTTNVAEGTNQYHTTARARAAISAGSGISYNSATGVVSASQSIGSNSTPTFAGLTLTGDIDMTGNIIPSADVTYDLGSPQKQWKDIYVGPGSLYVNGSKVLQDDTGTITFSADLDQNIRVKTTGNGILQLGSSTTTLQIDSTMQMTAGKRITSSDGVKVQFGDDVEMNSNKVIGLGAPSAATDAATKGYVDTAVGNISTSSIAAGNTNIAVTDTGSGTVLVTVDGSTALTVDATGVVVSGNFTVSGTQTVVNSSTINLADNIITLNSDATGAPSQNAGIEVERGDEANTQLRWNEGSQKWTFTNNGAVYYPMATGTDDLAEGSTNLYFTQGRARGAVSGSSATGVSYNSSTGTFSLGSIPNSSLTNTAVTIGSTSTALGATSTTLAGLTSVTSTGFTGALTGNASTATALATARTIAMSGDVAWTSLAFDGSGSVSSASTLATVNSSVGTYGSSTLVPVITVNGKGLVTSVTTSSISGALTFTGDVTGSGTTGASTALTIANSAVTNAKLANSSVTVTAGTGLSGGGAVSLGGSVTLTNAGVTSLNSSTGAKTLSHYHATFQTVSAGQETANVSGSVAFTFADLSGSVFHLVLLNRTPLRPTEYSVSGTTLTIASGFGLTLGDEIEVTGSKLA